MDLQALLLKLLLKLPSSLMVKLAGGKPISLAGRTLDPQLQLISHFAKRRAPLHTLSLKDARSVYQSRYLKSPISTERDASVTVIDDVISNGREPLPLRIFKPAGQDPNAPLLMYFHSGGGVFGDVTSGTGLCRVLARIAKCPVVSVDYRLAPENPWPAAVDDANAAYEWALANAERLGALPGQAAVAGASIGANLAAIICQDMKREHKPQPVLQLLLYPFVDWLSDRPSASLFAETFPLTKQSRDWMLKEYTGGDVALDHPRLSPIYETDLEGTARAIIVTAGFDLALDEGRAYCDRLNDAGVETEYRCFDNLCHDFVDFLPLSKAVEDACNEIATRLRYHIRS